MHQRNRSTSRKTRLSIGKFLNSESNYSNHFFEERNNNHKLEPLKPTVKSSVSLRMNDNEEAGHLSVRVPKRSNWPTQKISQFKTISEVEDVSGRMSVMRSKGAQGRIKRTPKCVKHSPRLAPRPQPRLEVFEFEQEQWQKAYRTMGELYTVTINKVPYGDVIREVPFHCAPVHHEFKAQYGLQNQFGATTTHDVPQKKDKEYTFTVRTQMPFFRPMRRHDTVDREISKVQRKHNIIYYPITAVKVIFTPGMLSYQGAWKMMMLYGPIECCLIEGTNYILVVYKTLLDADEAVRSEAIPHGVSISWLDKRLYNRGHFMELENYSVDQDPRWTEGLERRWCTQGMITTESISDLLAKKNRQTDSKKVPVLSAPAMPRRSSPAMPRRNSVPRRNSLAAARSSTLKYRGS